MVLESAVLDSDVLIQVVGAWRNLCTRAAGEGIPPAEAASPARDAVRFVLLRA
jgi:hypothetical protein